MNNEYNYDYWIITYTVHNTPIHVSTVIVIIDTIMLITLGETVLLT